MPPRLSLPGGPRLLHHHLRPPRTRPFTILSIETSCDDTSVSLLSTPQPRPSPATLLSHQTHTSPNAPTRGVHPLISLNSHRRHLSRLLRSALSSTGAKPDLIAVTRGPGMVASLAVGLDTAKGLAVAYDVPLIGVHHMQAHTLTPRLVSALEHAKEGGGGGPTLKPEFPFLTLLVSGGHTLLLHSAAVTSHTVLAESIDIALGDMIDKAARSLVPAGTLDAAKKLDGTVVYGAVLEEFCFPPADHHHHHHHCHYHYHPPGTNPRKAEDQRKLEKWGGGWDLSVPLASKPGTAFVGLDGTTESAKAFSFTGLGSAVERALGRKPDMAEEERRALGREVLTVAFEHLATRVAPALRENPEIKTLVVSGGVASNKFLRHLLKRHVAHAGFPEVELVAPPLKYCTDNAAMIAWAALEMYAEGYETDLSVMPIRRWSMDDNDPVETEGEGEWEEGRKKGGILGARGWTRSGDGDGEGDGDGDDGGGVGRSM